MVRRHCGLVTPLRKWPACLYWAALPLRLASARPSPHPLPSPLVSVLRHCQTASRDLCSNTRTTIKTTKIKNSLFHTALGIGNFHRSRWVAIYGAIQQQQTRQQQPQQQQHQQIRKNSHFETVFKIGNFLLSSWVVIYKAKPIDFK